MTDSFDSRNSLSIFNSDRYFAISPGSGEVIINSVQTSCTSQADCAAGFSCSGGLCVQSSTSDSGSTSGCGTGGTGGVLTPGDFGCIEIPGTNPGGCTTETCGNNGSGGAGSAEWCCGDWVCSVKPGDSEVTCACEYPEPPRCTVDTECPDGYYCSDGFCVPDFRECFEDSDCPEGYYCSGNWCIFDWTPVLCEEDSDCGENYVCVDGFCLFDWRDCDEEEPCPDGYVCIGGLCFPGCDEDSDCQDGETCVNGFCTDSCFADSECPDGEICAGGYCLPGCTEDNDCPDGYECVGSFCYPVFDSCDGDYQCNGSEACLNGFCIPTPPTCNDGNGCLENQICIGGQCFGFDNLPPSGEIDFDNCALVDAALINSVYVATQTVYSSCFDAKFQACGDDKPKRYEEVLIVAGQRYIKISSDTWQEIGCGSGGGGGAGGNDGDGVPPNPPTPPGGGSRCTERCDEATKAGIDPSDSGCPPNTGCSDCDYCETQYPALGQCLPIPPFDAPCYCEQGNPCDECEDCDKESGGCVSNDEKCKKCCITCDDCSGETVCTKKCYDMDYSGPMCPPVDCPPPDPPGDCIKCTSLTLCRPDDGVIPACPPGYSSKGTISAGGQTCTLCEKCDDSDCPPPEPEPPECTSSADCAQCKICNAEGECEGDPACDDCCPSGSPPGSKCVREQQLAMYRGSVENGYITRQVRSDCSGYTIVADPNGFYYVNFVSSCGIPSFAIPGTVSDGVEVVALTPCYRQCGPCYCTSYANGFSSAFC